MPITQDRMLAVIHAGLDFRDGLHKITEQIKMETISVQKGHYSAQQALDNLLSQSNIAMLLEDYAESLSLLTLEAKYFRMFYNRNAKAAEKRDQKRRAMGKPKRQPSDVHFKQRFKTTDIIPPPTGQARVTMDVEEEERRNNEFLKKNPYKGQLAREIPQEEKAEDKPIDVQAEAEKDFDLEI